MYTGAWRENQPHDEKGEGEYVFAASKQTITGKWIDGKFESKDAEYTYAELKVS